MASFLILLLLAGGTFGRAAKWKAGLTETNTYRLAEKAAPGSSTYLLRGILRDGRRVLEIEVQTQRKLILGGQEGNLVTRGLTIVDPATFDLLESRLTTTLNGSEASYLHAERQGNKIEIRQKLRGSPLETRTAEAPTPVVEETALLFYLARLPWTKGREFHWMRFSPAQGRLLGASARVEKEENQLLRVAVQTEIGPSVYHIRRGSSAVVVKTEAGGSEQMQLESSTSLPQKALR